MFDPEQGRLFGPPPAPPGAPGAPSRPARPGRRARGLRKAAAGTFVALDFETADEGPDSACSVALVRVEQREVVARSQRLIRPPRQRFAFTHIHGLTWEHVREQPPFGEVWPDLRPMLEGAGFIAAHNASFDEGVLRACCDAAHLAFPRLPWVCTVALARRVWRLFPTKLPDVCRHLKLDLVHHDPLSDAEACARIVIAAQHEGAPVG